MSPLNISTHKHLKRKYTRKKDSVAYYLSTPTSLQKSSGNKDTFKTHHHLLVFIRYRESYILKCLPKLKK